MRRRSFLKVLSGVLATPKNGLFPGMAQAAQAQDKKATVKPAPESRPRDFLKFAKTLRGEKGIVVGVFDDPKYAGREVPGTLRAEDFVRTWGSRPNVRVVLLDAYDVHSYSILFQGKMDILVYPYGSSYPMDEFPATTGDALRRFMKNGGALLTTGGVPFAEPLGPDLETVSDSADPVSSPKRGLPTSSTYRRFVAPFGFKYYEHPFPPSVTKVNQEFLPSLPANIPVAPCSIGLIANNSSHSPVPKPAHGNVFPERYPMRRILPLLSGMDEYGQLLATNALLIQDYESGGRSIHFTHQEEPHPLSPSSGHFAALMDDLLELLSNRLMVKSLETAFACYRQGEPVQARAEIVNFSARTLRADCAFEIYDGEIGNGRKAVYVQTVRVEVPAKGSAVAQCRWAPSGFAADEYEIRVRLERKGKAVSSAENGFVVWNQKTVEAGPEIRTAGQYFAIGKKESWLSGTNYYESSRGEIMWFHPDVKRIAADLRQMRQHGVNYVRPHYHHYKWFKDYLEFQHDALPAFFDEMRKVEDPLPPERGWRIFDMMIYLCQKHGIVYGGDLFTLVPQNMGDPRGWSPLLESVYCEEKRGIQRAFLVALNQRYKDVPGISWDLWNEPSVPLAGMRDWTNDHRRTIDSIRPRLLTVGGGTGEQLGEAVDYIGLHGYPDGLAKVVNQTDRPVIIQETYFAHEEDLASELLQAEELRVALLLAIKNGMSGFAPWSWTRQMRLWQDSYEIDPSFRMESWDDRLGTHVHDDGTIKPAGQVYRDFAVLLGTISFQDFHAPSGKIRTSVGEVIVETDNTNGHSLRHVSGNSCFAAVGRGSIAWNGKAICSGPSSKYLFAFAAESHDLATADRLYVKSEAPGELRVSSGSRQPVSVMLADISPEGERKLAVLPFRLDGGDVVISILPNQQAYWAAIEWRTAG